jgi:hypothetical protein
VDGDGVAGLVEQDAVIADAETEQPLKLAAKRLNFALAGFGVAVESAQDVSRPYGRAPGPW